MHSLKKSILFGFLVWLIPFLVAFLIYPIHAANRPLFESIMPVVLSISVVLFSYLYFKSVGQDVKTESIKLGLVFLFISLVLDLMLFMPNSPMHLSLSAYVADIGLTYVMIPVITIGMGYASDRRK